MSDEHLLVLRGSGSSVWHYPSDDDAATPACCHGDGASYKQLRPEIARAWYEQCATCADDRSYNGGQGDTALPTQVEVPTHD